MRIVKFLAVSTIATVALTGCSSTVKGSASPGGEAATTVDSVEQGDFDKDAAKEFLLTPDDLPGYMELPIVTAEDLGAGLGTPTTEDLPVEPAECANAFAQGTLETAQKEMADQSAITLLAKGASPTDVAIVVELVGPAALIKPGIDSLKVPTECESMKISKDGETLTVSMKELPLDIGSTSAGLEMKMNGTVSGQQIAMTMSMALIAESKGGIVLSVVGEEDLKTAAQKAYDKALPALK